MLAVELLVVAEWRAPNGSVMALKLHHDRFQSAGDGSMRPRLYPWPLGLCTSSVSAVNTSSVVGLHVCVSVYV